MAIDEIVSDPNLSAVLNTSRDTRLQALTLVDLIASLGPIENASTESQLEISKQQKLLITNLANSRIHARLNARMREISTTRTDSSLDVANTV